MQMPPSGSAFYEIERVPYIRCRDLQAVKNQCTMGNCVAYDVYFTEHQPVVNLIIETPVIKFFI